MPRSSEAHMFEYLIYILHTIKESVYLPYLFSTFTKYYTFATRHCLWCPFSRCYSLTMLICVEFFLLVRCHHKPLKQIVAFLRILTELFTHSPKDSRQPQQQQTMMHMTHTSRSAINFAPWLNAKGNKAAACEICVCMWLLAST